MKDPMKDWKFILGGESYRKLGTRFWRPSGLEKVAKPENPDERIHFTVRMLLNQKALLPPKSLIGSKIEAHRSIHDVQLVESVAESSAQTLSPRPLSSRALSSRLLCTGKFWRIPEEDHPRNDYEIKEEDVTDLETDLLASLPMSEKCLIWIINNRNPAGSKGDFPILDVTELGHSRSTNTRLNPVIDKLLSHLQNKEYLRGAEGSYDDFQEWKESHRWSKVFSRRKEDNSKQPASGNSQL